MSHPSACGVSADDVAVLVHDDLAAVGQSHGIAAIADALEVAAAGVPDPGVERYYIAHRYRFQA